MKPIYTCIDSVAAEVENEARAALRDFGVTALFASLEAISC